MFFSFFFLVILSNFFTILLLEKKEVRLALAIPAGAPAMFVNEIINTPPLAAHKQLKLDQYNQKQQHIYLIFYCMIFFD